MSDTPNFTAEEVRAAEQAEQAELDMAQRKHLHSRVVLLRLRLNMTEAALATAQERIQHLEEEPEPGADS